MGPMHWIVLLFPGVIAAVVAMLLTPSVMRLAVRLRAVDVPGGRKQHVQSTPRLGGIAIVAGIVVPLGPGFMLLSPQTFRSVSLTEILGFGAAALIVFALGVADDLLGLRPFQKLLVQVLAASIVVTLGWQFTALRLPWEGRFDIGSVAAVLLTLVWIVGVTNAINFIDGLDGLAAGIVAIIACSLLIMAILQRSPETAVVMSCVAGACLGFLRHNWRPAKIYMGDSGSLTLGFVLATISLRSTPSLKASAAVAILVPILTLGLPVIDTLMVMWYRFLRGHQRMNRLARMFHADRKHIHYLLLETHDKRPRVMFILYGLASGFCLMALLVAISGSLWLGLGFLGVEVAAVVMIRKAGLEAGARRLAEERLKRLERNPQVALGTEEFRGKSPVGTLPVLERAELSWRNSSKS